MNSQSFLHGIKCKLTCTCMHGEHAQRAHACGCWCRTGAAGHWHGGVPEGPAHRLARVLRGGVRADAAALSRAPCMSLCTLMAVMQDASVSSNARTGSGVLCSCTAGKHTNCCASVGFQVGGMARLQHAVVLDSLGKAPEAKVLYIACSSIPAFAVACMQRACSVTETVPKPPVCTPANRPYTRACVVIRQQR